MPDNNISKAQPSKAKGLGGVFPLRSKNAALLYMYRCVVFLPIALKECTGCFGDNVNNVVLSI